MVVTLAIWTEQRPGRHDDRKLPVWTYVENFQAMPSHYYRPAQGGIQGRLAGGSEMRAFMQYSIFWPYLKLKSMERRYNYAYKSKRNKNV